MPFDAKKHLRLAGSSEKPLKEEEAAEMLPFTFSPLVLPQYLSSTSAPEQLKSAIVGDETITFNHKMIQTDMLAAYPVLLPFHMVREAKLQRSCGCGRWSTDRRLFSHV